MDRVATFLSGGNATIVTGAGVSVDSGIQAYRGKDGRYMNPNYKCVLSSSLYLLHFFSEVEKTYTRMFGRFNFAQVGGDANTRC